MPQLHAGPVSLLWWSCFSITGGTNSFSTCRTGTRSGTASTARMVHRQSPVPCTHNPRARETPLRHIFAEALDVELPRGTAAAGAASLAEGGQEPVLPAAPLCSRHIPPCKGGRDSPAREGRTGQPGAAQPSSGPAGAGPGRAEPGRRSGARTGTAPQPWGGAATLFIKGEPERRSASGRAGGKRGRLEQDREGQAGRSRRGAVMELLRTIAHPPGGGGAKGCEAAAGRAAGGESRRKKAEEPPHQHGHPAAEVSRIITDPTTGKRYCRGKVLGKVMAAASSVPSRGDPAGRLSRRGGRRALPCGAAFPRRAPRCRQRPAQRRPSRVLWVRAPYCPGIVPSAGRARGKDLHVACGEWGARAFRQTMNTGPVLRKLPFAKEVALLD